MNISDFLITVSVSLTVGVFIGFFLRDMLHALRIFSAKRFKRSVYFDLDTKPED
ncbi:hypothetical protein [Vibrio ponticus]|uniref:hypothetical protein n=1 Tax=Vibrio ponticus TaxID=265668 RepID=UPI00142ED6A8|nr:hypothetical protein [Vibrio ponticus]